VSRCLVSFFVECEINNFAGCSCVAVAIVLAQSHAKIWQGIVAPVAFAVCIVRADTSGGRVADRRDALGFQCGHGFIGVG
jgi:hypothetical protein